MARNQIIYNVEDVFIGPCPASGYHFINYSGKLNNTYHDIPQEYELYQRYSPNPAVIHRLNPIDKNENIFPRNHNLLKRLDRIQNISYEINSTRTIVNHIGKAASIDRIHLTKPQINLNFSYILSSLRNESRMGFNVNYPRLEYPYTGDKYFYRTDNNDPLFLFSGFLDRSYLKKYPFSGSRGEGISVGSPCFEPIQPTPTPNPNFVSQNIPYYVGKNLNPIKKFYNVDLIDVAAGFYHSFVLTNGGYLTGWGDNQEGQLTNNLDFNNSSGEFTGIWENAIVGKLSGVKKISTNHLHNLAILNDDRITGWGYNENGEAFGNVLYNDPNYISTGNWSNSPLSLLANVTGISAGAYHSLALFQNGTLTGWGDNRFNQSSNGNNLNNIIDISAGGYHSLSIRNISGGLVTGWGDNEYGQASGGNILTGVKKVSAGHLHSFALLKNGKVTGWGWNDDGQVAGVRNYNNNTGIFTGIWENTPVGKLTGVKSIHAGWFHTLALLENNTITGWGFNNVGQINENISYNDTEGIFTGNWSSTIVGSFNDVINLDTSHQTSLAFNRFKKKEITGWGEDDVNYDLINNEVITDISVYHEYDCITNDPYWPLTTKDKRNIFIAIGEKEKDHNQKLYENFNIPDDQKSISTLAHQDSQTTRTIGFGNCYLSSYRQTASVGNFILAEVGYVGENMLFQMSGSGVSTPYIDPKTYETNTGIKFNIPSELDSKNPISALLPGDITVNINSSGYGLNFEDVRIQGYEFGFQFDRENLESIGYKLPDDKEVNLPLVVDLSIDFELGDQEFSDISALIREDKSYNVFIKCKNSCNYNPNFSWSPLNQSSTFEARFSHILSYEFFNCKFENISYSNQIGSRKVARMSFSTEIDPEDFTKGVQMSGLLNVEKIEDFLLLDGDGVSLSSEEKSYLLQEDENLVVTNLSVLY